MSSSGQKIESALTSAIDLATGDSCPPLMAQALRHAVFPGGKRLRPRLVLAVARATGGDDFALAMPAAVAIELLHCASLVHDDLPCFDNAQTRRGQPSVHAAFGERIAVLTGDALIVLAFDVLARAAESDPIRSARLVQTVAKAVGAPHGIAAGQAWECEPAIDLEAYHRAKTGALFSGATEAGAIAGNGLAHPWHTFGDLLGLAFQTADDLCDVLGEADALGKPVGQDALHGRPNAAATSVDEALARVGALIQAAVSAVPECPGRKALQTLVLREATRFLPPGAALKLAA